MRSIARRPGPGCTNSGTSRSAMRSRTGAAALSAPAVASAPAGIETPMHPRASTSSTSSGSALSSGTGPQAANRFPSAVTPSRCASIRVSAWSRGSASIPIGLDSAITASSMRSSSSRRVRRDGDSEFRSIAHGRSPAACNSATPPRSLTNGSSLLAASASIRGAVQMCWCTSRRIGSPCCRTSISTKSIEILLWAGMEGCRAGRGRRAARAWKTSHSTGPAAARAKLGAGRLFSPTRGSAALEWAVFERSPC